MTADDFTTAAATEAVQIWSGFRGEQVVTIRGLGVHMAEWARSYLAARILPDPRGGCVCIEHEQDAGGGHNECLTEYEPACPEHSEHVYNPRTGVWDLAAQEPTDAPLPESVANLIRDLTDPGDCWFDHGGGCQEHGYLSLTPEQECPHPEAKRLLAARNARGGTK